jgi:hypothetical protein
MAYWCSVADYSSTPLALKLGISMDSKVLMRHPPRDFVLDVDHRVKVRRRRTGEVDVVLAFFTDRDTMAGEIVPLSRTITPVGGLWIAWPKQSSGQVTDMSDHAVREVALPLGLVDNKVCAIDTTWTALRLVWRRERRPGGAKRGALSA